MIIHSHTKNQVNIKCENHIGGVMVSMFALSAGRVKPKIILKKFKPYNGKNKNKSFDEMMSTSALY
jgi:hypothetical protein